MIPAINDTWFDQVVEGLKAEGIDGRSVRHAGIVLSEYMDLTPKQAVETIMQELDSFYQDLSVESGMEATR